jgi:hypothetical protein
MDPFSLSFFAVQGSGWGSILKVGFTISGWWFGTFFIFHIWDNPNPIDELIFFRGVKTTNQPWEMAHL